MNYFDAFVKNHLIILVRTYFWTSFYFFDVVIHIMSTLYRFDDCTFIISLEIKQCEFSNFIFFFRIVLS